MKNADTTLKLNGLHVEPNGFPLYELFETHNIRFLRHVEGTINYEFFGLFETVMTKGIYYRKSDYHLRENLEGYDQYGAQSLDFSENIKGIIKDTHSIKKKSFERVTKE